MSSNQNPLIFQGLTQSPQERRRPGPPPAHLKTDRAIMVSVKGIEEKSGISAGVCGTKAGRQERPSSPVPGASHTLPKPSPQLSLEMDSCISWLCRPLTSLRKELGVNLLEVLLVDNSAGTLLGSGIHLDVGRANQEQRSPPPLTPAVAQRFTEGGSSCWG